MDVVERAALTQKLATLQLELAVETINKVRSKCAYRFVQLHNLCVTVWTNGLVLNLFQLLGFVRCLHFLYSSSWFVSNCLDSLLYFGALKLLIHHPLKIWQAILLNSYQIQIRETCTSRLLEPFILSSRMSLLIFVLGKCRASAATCIAVANLGSCWHGISEKSEFRLSDSNYGHFQPWIIICTLKIRTCNIVLRILWSNTVI